MEHGKHTEKEIKEMGKMMAGKNRGKLKKSSFKRFLALKNKGRQV